MIQIDILNVVPDILKQQIRDYLVDFGVDKVRKLLGDEVASKFDLLRSDGAFRRSFDQGLQRASQRFIDEYEEEDEDLVLAIAGDKTFFNNKDLQSALLLELK
jgi:hypothetical protein